jgi:hypothetical protein
MMNSVRLGAPKRHGLGWAGAGVQAVLVLVNLQVLVWVALRSNRAADAGGAAAQPGTQRAALTGHVERAAGWGADEAFSGVLDAEELPIEVWARAQANASSAAVAAVRALLSDGERLELREMCGRTLYHGLQNVVVSHQTGLWTFFATG